MTVATKAPTQSEEVLELARRSGGMVTPDQVVEFARDPETALHKAFEWDDTEAARQYRIEQARGVIRRVLVSVEDRPAHRALVSVSIERAGDGASPYRLVNDVMRDDTLRQAMLDDAIRELKAAKTKYGHLAQLAKVWNAVEEVT